MVEITEIFDTIKSVILKISSVIFSIADVSSKTFKIQPNWIYLIIIGILSFWLAGFLSEERKLLILGGIII